MVTVRSSESCNLSNFDQAAKISKLFGDESLGQERDERGRCMTSIVTGSDQIDSRGAMSGSVLVVEIALKIRHRLPEAHPSLILPS